MVHDAVISYIRAQRSAGVADDATRAELLKNGWKEGDIADAFTALSVPLHARGILDVVRSFASGNPLSMKGESAEVGARYLLLGGIMFIVASLALYYFKDISRHGTGQLIFGLFFITNVLNSLAAYFLFRALIGFSRSVAYRVFASLVAAIVALFAVVSTLHFAGLALGLNNYAIIPGVVLLVTYFAVLPLQAAVYLLSLISLWILRVKRRKQGIVGTPSGLLFQSYWIFLAVALLACADFFVLIMGNSRFF